MCYMERGLVVPVLHSPELVQSNSIAAALPTARVAGTPLAVGLVVALCCSMVILAGWGVGAVVTPAMAGLLSHRGIFSSPPRL